MSPQVPAILVAALATAAERWPGEIGWVFDETALTRRQMCSDVDRVAAALIARGVESGDRVAVWLPNRNE